MQTVCGVRRLGQVGFGCGQVRRCNLSGLGRCFECHLRSFNAMASVGRPPLFSLLFYNQLSYICFFPLSHYNSGHLRHILVACLYVVFLFSLCGVTKTTYRHHQMPSGKNGGFAERHVCVCVCV